ncbi:MAG: peptidylprolyl isomerase, partial [Bacteroidota bacterium]
MAVLCLALIFLQIGPVSADTSIVASVGRFVITAHDLMDSYEFGPAFLKRKPDALRAHLEYMIYERLIALEAERLRYDTTRFVRDRVFALEEDLAVDELYRDEILSRVNLTEEEIGIGVVKARTNIRLRWIFTQDMFEATQIARKLEEGVPFDSLYALQFSPPERPDERVLETTLLELERNNPEFASQIAQIRSQEVTAPLEGPDGFYIVRVDEIWQNPLLTESEYQALKVEAVKVLRMVNADQLAKEYVHTMLIAANPVMKAAGFNIVRAYLAEKGLSRDTRIQWDIPSTFMTEAGPLPITASGEFVSRPLVSFAGQALTVRDYLRWFDIRQFQLKTSSLKSFNSSVKRTIWKMVQDNLLSQEAYWRGTDLRDTIQQETRKWEAKLLYLAGRSHLMRTITISDADVKRRFEEQQHQYVDGSGKLLSFDQARQHVWADLYREEERRVLLRAIQRLRKNYPVIVHEDIVRQLSSRIQRELSPIDVIFYKPGGTFPRVAF